MCFCIYECYYLHDSYILQCKHLQILLTENGNKVTYATSHLQGPNMKPKLLVRIKVLFVFFSSSNSDKMLLTVFQLNLLYRFPLTAIIDLYPPHYDDIIVPHARQDVS